MHEKETVGMCPYCPFPQVEINGEADMIAHLKDTHHYDEEASEIAAYEWIEQIREANNEYRVESEQDDLFFRRGY